jgi:hypothetical protein
VEHEAALTLLELAIDAIKAKHPEINGGAA